MNGMRMWQNKFMASSTEKIVVEIKSQVFIRSANAVASPFSSTRLLLFCDSMIVQAKFCDGDFSGIFCAESGANAVTHPSN